MFNLLYTHQFISKKIILALCMVLLSSVSIAKTASNENTVNLVSDSWLDDVKKDIQASLYYFTLGQSKHNNDTHYSAANVANGYQTKFTQQGLSITPSESQNADWSWGLSLESITVDNKKLVLSNSTLQVDGNQLEYQSGNITEWYINNQKGLEQGFTIHRASSNNSKLTQINLNINGNTLSKLKKIETKIY